MSIQAVAWALEQHINDPRSKLVLISLANHADHVTGRCWPSMATIGREASCRRETVLRHVKALEESGFIKVIRAAGGLRKRVHTYELCMSRCATDAHQTGAQSKDLMCADRTSNCATHRTSMNHHRTITSPLPSSPPPPVENLSRSGNGKEATQRSAMHPASGSSVRSERPETIQNRIAQRLGPDGWMILGNLSVGRLDQLTAQERAGRLNAETLERVRIEAREAQPP